MSFEQRLFASCSSSFPLFAPRNLLSEISDVVASCPAHEVRRRTRDGVVISTFVQGLGLAIRVSAMMIMARLLCPDDFGLVGIAGLLLTVAEYFKDLGLSTAAIQSHELSHQQASCLFWLNAGISTLVAAAMFLGAGKFAEFYERAELVEIVRWYAICFVLGGLSVQHAAMLTRCMKFGTLATIQVTSQAGGILIGILAAKAGVGYRALVYMALATETINLALCWRMARWVPKLNAGFSESVHLLRFGAGITVYNLLRYFAGNTDKLILGKLVGAVGVGLYDRAKQLMLLPVNNVSSPLHRVGLPSLSALQFDPDSYRRELSNLQFTIAALTVPGMLFLSAYSADAIRVVFGTQWGAAVPAFFWLAIAGAVIPLAETGGLVMVTTGHSSRCVWWGVLRLCVFVPSVAIGASWGISGAAASFCIAQCVFLIPSMFLCYRRTPARVRDTMSVLWQPFCATGIALACTVMIADTTTINSPIIRLLVRAAVFGAVYAACLVASPGSRERTMALLARH